MTEHEWLHPTKTAEMLKYFRSKASDRKKRLFACGLCYRFWKHLTQEGVEAVRMAELYADGMVESQQMENHHLEAGRCLHSNSNLRYEKTAALLAAKAASHADANEAMKTA